MAVYVNNLTINAGTDFTQTFDLYDNQGNPINLANYSALSKLRKHAGSSTSVSFTVSFVDRSKGKIKLFIPSWITSNLKSGKYVYDVLLTKPTGSKSIIIEGTINARGSISIGCSFSTPTSAQRLCIAVIDENSETGHIAMGNLWDQFRSTYPNRTFYLLQPTTNGYGTIVNNDNYDTLACPDSFLNETTVNVPPLI